MSLATTDKRNRVAADLAGLIARITSTAAQVQQDVGAVLVGLNALEAAIANDADFDAGDLADIETARQQLATTITTIAQQLAAQVNPPEGSEGQE